MSSCSRIMMLLVWSARKTLCPEALYVKALSVRQPWAWAIIHAGKDSENRNWKTRFRGRIAIHAAGRIDRNAKLPQRSKKPRVDKLTCGAIIGTVDIVDVIDDSRSKWFTGEFGFMLANIDLSSGDRIVHVVLPLRLRSAARCRASPATDDRHFLPMTWARTMRPSSRFRL